MIIKNATPKDKSKPVEISSKGDIKLTYSDYAIKFVDCNNAFPQGHHTILLKDMSTMQKWKVIFRLIGFVFWRQYPEDLNTNMISVVSRYNL